MSADPVVGRWRDRRVALGRRQDRL